MIPALDEARTQSDLVRRDRDGGGYASVPFPAALEAGADDYIRKPIEPARFNARVRAGLRRAGRL